MVIIIAARDAGHVIILLGMRSDGYHQGGHERHPHGPRRDLPLLSFFLYTIPSVPLDPT